MNRHYGDIGSNLKVGNVLGFRVCRIIWRLYKLVFSNVSYKYWYRIWIYSSHCDEGMHFNCYGKIVLPRDFMFFYVKEKIERVYWDPSTKCRNPKFWVLGFVSHMVVCRMCKILVCPLLSEIGLRDVVNSVENGFN